MKRISAYDVNNYCSTYSLPMVTASQFASLVKRIFACTGTPLVGLLSFNVRKETLKVILFPTTSLISSGVT